MGYRDDLTALKSQEEILQREIAPLHEQLARLKKEAETLRRTIAKKKIRIAVFRVGRWFARHPKITAVLVVILLLFGWVFVQGQIKASRRRKQLAILLGTSCPTELEVKTSFSGSRVYINDLQLGKSPISRRVCPGTYLLRVVHARALPWHRQITIRKQTRRKLAFHVNQVPWRPSDRPPEGQLVFSEPAGALLFIDGEEVGRTPVYIKNAKGKRRKEVDDEDPPDPEIVLLALWTRSHGAHVWRIKRRPVTWLHVAKGQAKVFHE